MDWKNYLKKILFPKWYVIVVFIILLVVGLIFCFSYSMEDTLFAYLLYPFSFYALVIAILGSRNIWKQHLWPFLNQVPFFHRLFYDVKYRTLFFTRFSVIMNVLYGLLQIGYGAYYRTLWFVTLGVYYILLIVMRTGLLRNVQAQQIGISLKSEYKRYLQTGILLLFMNLIVSCVIMIHREPHPSLITFCLPLLISTSLLIILLSTFHFLRILSKKKDAL